MWMYVCIIHRTRYCFNDGKRYVPMMISSLRQKCSIHGHIHIFIRTYAHTHLQQVYYDSMMAKRMCL